MAKKVLFVCLGNICRSPMAEGIFRHKANELGLKVEFDSCGTSGWHQGESPDKRAQKCLEGHGISIADLRAREFQSSDFSKFDVIYTMDESNHTDVLASARNPEEASKVKMMLNESKPGKNMSVPDPYFGEGDGFEHVFELLTEAANSTLKKWQNE